MADTADRATVTKGFIRSAYLQPVLPMLLGFAAGIVGADGISAPFWIGSIAAVSALLVAALNSRRAPVFVAALFLGSASLGWMRMHLESRETAGESRLPIATKAVFEGRITERPVLTLHGTRFPIDLTILHLADDHAVPVESRVMVFVPEKIPSLYYGDRLRLKLTLREPRNFDTPGAFDYARHLRRMGIRWVGSVTDARSIAVLGDEGSRWEKWFGRKRNVLDRYLGEHLAPNSAALAKAFLLGRRQDLKPEEVEAFQRAGVVHVLSISGMHMMVVSTVSYIVVAWALTLWASAALWIPIRKIAATLALAPTLFYLYLAGAEPPAVRSAALVILYLACTLLERPRDPYHALALTAFLLLLARSSLLFDLSFQLTFLSVLGILMADREFSPASSVPGEKRGPVKRTVRWVRRGMVATIGATAMTAPIVLQAFNLFSPAAFLANMIVGPLSSLAVVLLLIIAPWAWLPWPVPSGFLQVVDGVLWSVTGVARWFGGLPAASVWVPTPSAVQWVALVGGGIGLLLIRRRPGRVLLLASAVVLVTTLFFPRQPREEGILTATFLDVGQGDSAWVKLPSGEGMLVDAGGGFDQTFDVGRNVVARFLWHERVQRVDILCLSHPHADHIDGAMFILEAFDVGEIWTTGDFPAKDGYGKNLLERAALKGVVHRVLHDGDRPSEGPGWRVDVLSPPGLLFAGGYDTANDNSLVIKITHGHAQILFPGDIGVRAEQRMVLSGKDVQADLLKVAHHGSITASAPEFLRAVSPRYAVISSGMYNRYGVPRREVLERLGDVGTEILRTDRDGTTRFISNGKEIRMTVSPSGPD